MNSNPYRIRESRNFLFHLLVRIYQTTLFWIKDYVSNPASNHSKRNPGPHQKDTLADKDPPPQGLLRIFRNVPGFSNDRGSSCSIVWQGPLILKGWAARRKMCAQSLLGTRRNFTPWQYSDVLVFLCQICWGGRLFCGPNGDLMNHLLSAKLL